MKYPSWKDFESKYPDYQEIAFEALARMLFRCRYELGDSLPYFKNHAGNETETIVVDGEEIGFQAKYFEPEKAPSPILVTVFGIVIEVKLLQPEKA